MIFTIYWGTVSWGGGVVPGKLADLVLFLSFYSGLTPYGPDTHNPLDSHSVLTDGPVYEAGY